jgi:hypothetical protein
VFGTALGYPRGAYFFGEKTLHLPEKGRNRVKSEGQKFVKKVEKGLLNDNSPIDSGCQGKSTVWILFRVLLGVPNQVDDYGAVFFGSIKQVDVLVDSQPAHT